jgi:phosphatidylglycerophosphatase A
MAKSSTSGSDARTPSFLTRFIATGAFSGYSPIASGTAGSLVGLLIYCVPGIEAFVILGPVIVISFIAGVITSSKMEHVFGKDPSIVVIDEVVGMWISLLFIPKTILLAFLCFFWFRIYDIIKPPPARQIDATTGGLGIMLDDVVAAIYANVTVQVIGLIFPIVFEIGK